MQYKWSSEQLRAVLSGEMPWDDAPDSIKSWAAFYFYEAALEIIVMDDLAERKKALTRIPGKFRGLVENEVKRLWPHRDELRKSKGA